MARKVICIARQDDIHADAVLDFCSQRGADLIRFDVSSVFRGGSNFKIEIEQSRPTWAFTLGSHCVSGDDDIAIFCRDWEIPQVASSDDLEQCVRNEETRNFLNAWAGLVRSSRWIDHPVQQSQWDNKLLQTALAQFIGFKTPKTIATNEPEMVRSFAGTNRVVIKQLSNIAFDGLDHEDEFVFTTPINPHHLEFSDEIANCPVLVQERIEKIADLRVTVVGCDIFPALIHSNRECGPLDIVDFRALPEELIERTTIPNSVSDFILEMMRRMDLRFAAFDFGLTEEKDCVFFEANVSGNWLWIEHATGLQISAAVANLLMTIQ
jgi:glutathione synthase/RimK-type ligase-like ATP-grasp enzyme